MKKLDNKGETLIEVVLSVAIFSLIMLMTATMFLSAIRTSTINYDNEIKIDQLLSAAAKKEGSTLKTGNITFDMTGMPDITKKIEVLETNLPNTMSMYQFCLP